MNKLRSALFSLWFYLVSTVLVLIGLPIGLLAPRFLTTYAKLWTWLICAALPICGIKLVIEGREHLPASGRMLIASQHQSAFDTLIWFLLLADCRYVVKIELLHIPLFGWLARRAGQLGVDRAAGAAAMRKLLRDATLAWQQGAQVVIFPEGTRSEAGQVAHLHPGVAALGTRSGLPVIPVTTDSGWFWRKGPFGKRPGTIHLRIHPALPPNLPRADLLDQLRSVFLAGADAGRPAGEQLVDRTGHSA